MTYKAGKNTFDDGSPANIYSKEIRLFTCLLTYFFMVVKAPQQTLRAHRSLKASCATL
jgi:hypothetical protein